MFETLLDRLVAGEHAADRRGPQPREAIAVVAALEVAGVVHAIEIANVSTGGLMAKLGHSLAENARVVVILDGERLTGWVRWQHDGRFGLCFDRPLTLDPAIIERHRPASVESTKQMSRWMI